MSEPPQNEPRSAHDSHLGLMECGGYFRHPTALVSPKARIGSGTRIWAYCNIMAEAVIGRDCNVCDHCFVEKGAVIGDEVTIKNCVAVFAGVRLESKVFVGSHVGFTNDRRPRSRRTDWECLSTLVKEGATLGSHAVLIAGVTVGRWAMVGAGSVVTHDVPDFALVVGSPARVVGYVCFCGRSLNKDLWCRDCGRRFVKNGDAIEPV